MGDKYLTPSIFRHCCFLLLVEEKVIRRPEIQQKSDLYYKMLFDNRIGQIQRA